jgi:hypothetical protein
LQPTVKATSLHLVDPGHSFIETMPYQAGSSAQRFRIGLTGLAVTFIIVLFFSAITRSSRDEASNAAQQAAMNEPSEPLAELGVAPGASESTNNTAARKK